MVLCTAPAFSLTSMNKILALTKKASLGADLTTLSSLRSLRRGQRLALFAFHQGLNGSVTIRPVVHQQIYQSDPLRLL